MSKICKKVAQHFHCAVSKVFDRVKSVVLWSANIRILAKDHKGYGSTATSQEVFIYTVPQLTRRMMPSGITSSPADVINT
jgi:hypothetical protein